MITQAELVKMFDYHHNGYLVRKYSGAGRSNKAGATVGNYGSKNLGHRNCRYISTKINGQHYSVHLLIYCYHHGVLPKQLDHANGNSLDNRIENLRLATNFENAQNRKKFVNNTSGVKNVSWHKAQQKWFVYIDVNKKRKNIGYFKDLEFAELVALEAREKYHGAFANLS